MKRLAFLIAAPLVLIIAFIAFGIYWWGSNSQAPTSNAEDVRFIIPRGWGAMQVAAKLKEQGLIKSPLAFKVYVQATGVAGKIQAGEYDLASNSNLSQLVAVFLKGPSSIWVTIPEGLRREEIAVRFADGLSKTGTDRQTFIEGFLNTSDGKEGYLFPDTYLYPKDITGEKAAGYLLDTFDIKIEPYQKEIEKSSLGLNKIITLASLIEREAKGDEERPVIAGILLKRAENDWPLQVDAAVQYAVASQNCQKADPGCEWWPILTKDDLDVSSKFNTYKYAGFPPSPISNPGILSIKAAISPQDSAYWFYLHDKEGNIHYAKTIEEHNQNIRTYLGK